MQMSKWHMSHGHIQPSSGLTRVPDNLVIPFQGVLTMARIVVVGAFLSPWTWCFPSQLWDTQLERHHEMYVLNPQSPSLMSEMFRFRAGGPCVPVRSFRSVV